MILPSGLHCMCVSSLREINGFVAHSQWAPQLRYRACFISAKFKLTQGHGQEVTLESGTEKDGQTTCEIIYPFKEATPVTDDLKLFSIKNPLNRAQDRSHAAPEILICASWRNSHQQSLRCSQRACRATRCH